MKVAKRILLLFLGLIAAFLLFLVWYQYRYSMDVVASYAINSTNSEKSLLVATQGSDFKDSLTNVIVNHFKSGSIYIQVIDVSSLEEVDVEDFDAITIIHTWENWKPPVEVQSFVDRTKDDEEKIVVMTTSGEGSYKMDGIDAFTGESIIANVPDFAERIIDSLNSILKGNN